MINNLILMLSLISARPFSVVQTICRSCSSITVSASKSSGLPSLLLKEAFVNRILSGYHEPSLEKNILLSDLPHTGWSHIELTKEHIRIEYNGITEEYQQSAALYFEDDEELEEKGIPLCLKPVKIENKVSVGAGATIFLDRSAFADFLRERLYIA